LFFDSRVAGADLSLREVPASFRDQTSADMAWADSRRNRFRRKASRVKISSLVLAALSTVIVGIEATSRSWVALLMVAAGTVLAVLEALSKFQTGLGPEVSEPLMRRGLPPWPR
jgi:hypothetical protein